MNDRERFQAIMHYKPVDRCVIQDFQYWDETLIAWREYGLPQSIQGIDQAEEFFGMDPMWTRIGGVSMMLHPGFEHKILEDDGVFEIARTYDGSTTKRQKVLGSIPQHLDHALKDRSTWEKEFKWRLDPSNPDRLAPNLEQELAAQSDVRRTWPLQISVGSLFGQLRNWMGIEGVSYIQYDDPKLFAEMVQTIADCIVGVLERALKIATKVGVTFDYSSMWEDMAYSHGPLLGVPAFERLLLPNYQRITGLLRQHGCDLCMLDCDGDSNLLYPGWLKSGVNIAFPLEIGTWGNDPIKARKQYGQEMRIAGGFAKTILAKGPDAIDREIDRLAPLVEEGGFIPFCDHRVPPDVSLENYLHYVRQAKKVWGKGLPNLRPTQEPNKKASHYGKPYDHRIILGDGPAAH